MWGEILSSAISGAFSAAGSALVNTAFGGSDSGGGGRAYDPFTTAMSQRSAESLMSPVKPKQRRPSEPAATASPSGKPPHPLQMYTNAFRGS